MATSALEIGQNYLRAVRLGRKGNNLVTLKSAQSSIEDGIILDGKILNPNKFTELLRNFVKSNHFSSSSWIITIPDKVVFTTYKTFPNLSYNDLAGAVEINLNSLLPGKIEEISWGWQEIEPLEKISGKMVEIASISKKDLQTYLACFAGAGIAPMAIEPKSLSIARVAGESHSTLTLALEGLSITAVISSGGFPHFSRDFILPKEEKEQYKALLAEIRRAMNFYLIEKNETTLENVILDGPGASMALLEALKGSLNIPVKLAKDIYPQSNLPSLAVFGAGVRTLSEPGTDTNLSLLPVGTREAEHEKKILLFYGGIANILAITAILFLLMFSATFGFLKYLNKKAQSDLASASTRTTTDQVTSSLISDVKEINTFLNYEATLEGKMTYWSNILAAINNAKGEQITITSYDYPSENQPLSLVGVAQSSEALGTFRANLQNLSIIESVSMPSSSSDQSQNVNFTITCNLKKDALNGPK